MQFEPWWKRHAGRLEFELHELEVRQIRHEVDEHARTSGIIRVRAWHTVDREQIEFIATYPDLYPYFRFEVQAPSLTLPYHQNPFEKNLCLLGRYTGNWKPSLTLAWALTVQVPELLRVAGAREKAAVEHAEEHQAEPFTAYYPVEVASLVVVDTEWQIDPREKSGTFIVAALPDPPVVSSPAFRGVVLEVRSQKGGTLARADPAIRDSHRHQSLVGQWARRREPIPYGKPSEFRKALAALDMPSPRKNRWRNGQLQLWGVLAPQEVNWRDPAQKEGWIFLAQHEQDITVIPPWGQNHAELFPWYEAAPRSRFSL